MSPIKEVILNKQTNINPIWIMRQAGRYLPEFRKIREQNKDFIKLCLNEKLSSEITLQPLKRYDLDAAIIFSDILIVPYGLDQDVQFKKGLGPILGELNLDKLSQLNENEFVEKVNNVYKAIDLVSKSSLTQKKSTIGFVGAPWTLLVYMVNKKSPKLKLQNDFLNNSNIIDKIFTSLDKFLKIHIKNQINNGAEIIQIFDSWSGLLDEKDLSKYVYDPTASLVEYVKSFNVPVICFPRGIRNYKSYCDFVKPDVISIDYDLDPVQFRKEIKIPVQGGLDPKVLLTSNENIKKEAKKYLDIFKDHPYIFNLGHGVLPETNPNAMDYLVKLVKDY